MKIILFGYGKMGKMVEKIAQDQGHSVLAKLSQHESIPNATLKEADVCIDFSHPDALMEHLHSCIDLKKPLVIGTTGWEHQLQEVKHLIEKSEIGCLYSPNFSIGIARFNQLVAYAAQLLNDFSEAAIIELHHKHKIDAPSGTAKLLHETLTHHYQHPIPISSVRCGTIPGTHEIYFDSPYDTIKLTHQARNREGFAYGALQAAQWLINKKGFFTLEDLDL